MGNVHFGGAPTSSSTNGTAGPAGFVALEGTGEAPSTPNGAGAVEIRNICKAVIHVDIRSCVEVP
jgi:hypothetical protein